MTTNVVDYTAYPSASAPMMTDGHKFSAVWRLSRRILDRSKNAILPTPPAFGDVVGMIPSQFHQDFRRQRTRVPDYFAA